MGHSVSLQADNKSVSPNYRVMDWHDAMRSDDWATMVAIFRDRIVGMVIANGLNLNRDMVRVGLAWVYPQYCNRTECRDWRELEQ